MGQEVDGSLVIFVMATYGEGDPTDNAQEFFDWLKETTDNLQGLKYTVSPSFFNYISNVDDAYNYMYSSYMYMYMLLYHSRTCSTCSGTVCIVHVFF